jgi:hypothetical protein
MPIKLFGGITLEGGSPELQEIFVIRSQFAEAYCKENKWTEPLSIEQVLEIRSQPEWKNAGREK